MTNQPSIVRTRLAFVALFVALLATFGWSSRVSAHTDFESSVPQEGATVDGPLSTVTVQFTNPAVESGAGFELLQPDGTVRTPESVDPTDGTSFVMTFLPPLGAGTYGFRWDVQAGDAHPIQGSFRFTVQDPDASASPAPATSTPEAATPASAPSTSVPVDHSTMSMDAFLADDDAPAPFAGRAARTMSMGSTVFAAGVFAALVWVIRGTRDEIDRLMAWVRLAGLGLITGGLTALAALDENQSMPISDIMTTKPGLAALLTMAGGALVFIGFVPREDEIVGTPRSLSAAVAVEGAPDRRSDGGDSFHQRRDADELRWIPGRTATLGLTGILLAVGAFWFDGHTVSRGPWVVHAGVNLVHVTAASVWVGGVFAMTLVAWMRKRRRTATGLGGMVVRFSTPAAIALAALSVAGTVMAWLVLESPGDLVSTNWGRILLVKVGAVALAAALGAYNHVRLRPALEARPDDPDVAAHLRVSLLIESSVMVGVIVATAVLVAAST